MTTAKLPVVNFAAGDCGYTRCSARYDAAGAGVFVGSGIFKSSDPAKSCRIVKTVTNALMQSSSGAFPRISLRLWSGIVRARLKSSWKKIDKMKSGLKIGVSAVQERLLSTSACLSLLSANV